jgi:hypothetical protein
MGCMHYPGWAVRWGLVDCGYNSSVRPFSTWYWYARRL